MSKPTLSLKTVLNENTKGKALSDEDIRRLQQCMVTCAGELIEACEKHGIKLILQGGSLLGYVRHHGFIPWDDDMDFGLLREDYDKFIEIFDEELSDRYIMSAPRPGYPSYNRFVQVFRKGTVLTNGDEDRSGRPQTIYLDIFPLDYAPENAGVRKVKGFAANALMGIAGCVDFYKTVSAQERSALCTTRKGRFLYRLRIVAGRLFAWKTPKRWFELVDRMISNANRTSFITSATGRKHYLGEVIPTESFLPLQRVNFEGLSLYAPCDPDAYLSNLYGDYMTIPPVEKRERHFATKVVTL